MLTLGLSILLVAALLVVAVMLIPLARRAEMPHSLLLTVSGIAIGLVVPTLNLPGISADADFVARLGELGFGIDAVFYLLLVPMIFDSAVRIDAGQLLDDVGPIMLLAIVGTILCMVAIGYSLVAVSPFPLVVCLLIGAIAASTDPLPVQEVFDEVGVPKRIDLLAEGESLFSDSTALVAFALLFSMLTGSSEATLTYGLYSFLEVTLGGILIGYGFARLFSWLLGFLGKSHIGKNTLTLCMAFICYIVTEDVLGYSGVIALVAAAMVLATHGRAAFSPSNWSEFIDVSGQVCFVAKSLVFLLVGMIVPTLVLQFDWQELGLVSVVFVAAFAARAATIFLFLPGMSALRLADPVDNSIKIVMFWGASRGAISLALALAILESPAIDDATAAFIGTTICGFVLATLFINSATMHPLLNVLHLKRLGRLEVAIRDRAIFDALTELSDEVDSQRRDAPAELEGPLREAVADFNSRSRALFDSMPKRRDLEADEWITIALAAVAQLEQRICLRYLENRLISTQSARRLLAWTADLIDSTRHTGESGYRAATKRCFQLTWTFRFALWLQAHFQRSGLLARLLTARFDSVFALALLLEEITENADNSVAKLVYRDQMNSVNDALEFRRKLAREELDRLTLAFPDHGQSLEQKLHRLSIIRLEQQKYADMLDDALIGQEVFAELQAKTERKIDQLDIADRIRPGLDPRVLIDGLPQFHGFAAADKAHLARTARVCLLAPGQSLPKIANPGRFLLILASGRLTMGDGRPVAVGQVIPLTDETGSAAAISGVTVIEYCRLLLICPQRAADVGLTSTADLASEN